MKFLLTAIFAAHSAFAYTPPSHFIMSKMLEDRSKLKSIEMVGKITDLRTGAAFNETLWVDFASGKLSSSYASLSSGDALMGSFTTVLSELHPMGKAWIEIGMDSNAERVKKAMEVLGVSAGPTTKISRVEGRAQWSWGSENRLQLEKDEFAFSAYEMADQSSIQTHEMGARLGDMRFPKVLSVKKTGQALFKYELKGLKINPASRSAVPTGEMTASNVREWVELVR